jgi:hypothetical protein
VVPVDAVSGAEAPGLQSTQARLGATHSHRADSRHVGDSLDTEDAAESRDSFRTTAGSMIIGLPARHERAASSVREAELVASVQRPTAQPCVHHYKSAVVASTIVCISLRMDNMALARYHDKVIHVPERRYEDMHNTRPAALMSRYCPLGWPLHPHTSAHFLSVLSMQSCHATVLHVKNHLWANRLLGLQVCLGFWALISAGDADSGREQRGHRAGSRPIATRSG